MTYIRRLIDDQLASALNASGLVLIEGARGCGKTETAKQYAKSIVQLDRDPSALALSQIDPKLVLQGDHPRLIDEWQLAPGLWNEARHQVDEAQKPGLFIFTGSASALGNGIHHPGSGRAIKLRMRTMGLQERGISDGSYSLGKLFAGWEQTPVVNQTPIDLPALLSIMCTGGWPAYRNLDAKDALRFHNAYLQDVVNLDLKTLEGPSDPQLAKRILIAVARTLGAKTPATKIMASVVQSGIQVKHQTIQSYLSQFERLWITEEIPAWVPHLRSRYSVTQSARRYFSDASLAISALSANPAKLLQDLKTTGFLFENFVLNTLLSTMDALGGSVRHYRDESGLEVDAILEDDSGRWAAVEIKLGFNSVEEAAVQLLRFKQRVDTTIMGEPTFLAVVTNTQHSYRRSDGVHVVGISAIGL